MMSKDEIEMRDRLDKKLIDVMNANPKESEEYRTALNTLNAIYQKCFIHEAKRCGLEELLFYGEMVETQGRIVEDAALRLYADTDYLSSAFFEKGSAERIAPFMAMAIRWLTHQEDVSVISKQEHISRYKVAMLRRNMESISEREIISKIQKCNSLNMGIEVLEGLSELCVIHSYNRIVLSALERHGFDCIMSNSEARDLGRRALKHVILTLDLKDIENVKPVTFIQSAIDQFMKKTLIMMKELNNEPTNQASQSDTE